MGLNPLSNVLARFFVIHLPATSHIPSIATDENCLSVDLDREYVSTQSNYNPDAEWYTPSLDKVVDAPITISSANEITNAEFNLPVGNQSFIPSSSTIPVRDLTANIIYRKKQRILTVSDDLTYFTTATFMSDTSIDELRNSLRLCCLPLKVDQSLTRVHCSLGLQKLMNFDTFVTHEHDIILVAKHHPDMDYTKSNGDLQLELFKLDPSGNPVSATDLLSAVGVVNSHIHSNGLSSQQMLTNTRQDKTLKNRFSVTRVVSNKHMNINNENHSCSALSLNSSLPSVWSDH